MSGPVIPFRRPQAATVAVVRYPEGVPAALVPDPEVISYAAAALAQLAGENLETVTAERFDQFRALAVFAATLAHHDGRMLAGYYLEAARVEPMAIGQEATDYRRAKVAALVAGLQSVIRACAGFASPRRHAEIIGAIRADVIAWGKP